MEYRKVCKFKFFNSDYQLLLDNYNRYFFLRINKNNKYQYVTLEEYVILSAQFLKPASIMCIKNEKINIVPKVIAGGVAVALSLTMLTGCSKTVEKFVFGDAYDKAHEEINYERSIQDSLSFAVEDGSTPYTEDTYFVSEWYTTTYVYDNDYLDNVLPTYKPTKEDLINTVNSNSKISKEFKPYIIDYIDKITTKYPNIEYRIFYENLKTLEVQELTKEELMAKTLSFDSEAAYDNVNNAIYVLKGNTYEPGSWSYQTLFHELSHALRTRWTKDGNTDIRIQGWGPNLNLSLVNEMLNSVFAVSIYDDELLGNGCKDVAYQLQSNYLIALLDVLDNYSIEDYVNHSASHLASAMDEVHGDTNYGSVILALLNAQYEDYHSRSIEIPEEEYYPLYDYICDLYFAKYIQNDMSYEDAKAVCNKLVNIIIFDVPEEYHIDTNRFYDNLDTYCETIGISQNTRN